MPATRPSLFTRLFRRTPKTNRNPNPINRARLGLTALEARDCPAYLSAGVLMIDGTDGPDNVIVTQTIPATWYEQAKVQVVHNGVTQTFNKSHVRSSEVRFQGKGGTDSFACGAYLYVTADGGNGPDVLSGGPMDDTLIGGTNNDAMYGNGGNDTLTGGQGNDEMRGGADNDTLSGEGDNDTIRGGPGHDYLFGNDGHDTMYGDNNAGTAGGAGNDVLYGGIGNDTMYGEGGWDTIEGGNDTDKMYGGTGNDTLRGQGGQDWLYGEGGDDGLFGGANEPAWGDFLYGGADADRFLVAAQSYDSGATYMQEDGTQDLSAEDARVIFLNGYAVTVDHSPTETVDYTAKAWTDAEVVRSDAVLELLHREGRGTRLLETPAGGDMVIVLHGNADRGYNDGRLHMTQQTLQFGGTDTDLRGYLLHEIAHAWQGDNFSSGGTNYWGQFVGLSGWTSTPQDDPAYALSTNEGRLVLVEGMFPYFDYRWYLDNGKYASEYAKTNEGEDFAESFAAYFTMRAGWTFYNSQPGAAAIPEKMDLFANWMAGL